MEVLWNDGAMQTWAVCTAILALKAFGSSVYTGVQRQRSAGYINEEDAAVFGKGASAGETESPAVAHGLRIQRNDAENLPAFFAVSLAFVLSGASESAVAVYLWTFTACRVAHTFFYMNHMQPWRAIAFFAGALCVVGMAVQIIAGRI